jgi:hypothetical protein
VVASPVVYATDFYAVPTSYTGTNITVQVNSQLGYSTQGGGGEFAGTLTNQSSTINTAFWCVDDQEAFYWGESRPANVTLLSNVTTDASQVRYGNVTNTSTPIAWTNNGPVPGYAADSLPALAQSRYTLAAYLVSQYPGFDGSIDQSLASDPGESDAIQEAIWAITNTNSTVSNGTNPGIYENGFTDLNGTTGGNADDSVAYWVNQALLHSSTVNPNGWAVVSWSAVNGVLGTGGYGDSASTNQTFLVEVGSTQIYTTGAPTPEPAFYGLLAAGLSGLFFAARRKNRA